MIAFENVYGHICDGSIKEWFLCVKKFPYACSRYQQTQVIHSCKRKFLPTDVRNYIHTYPPLTHPDSESQTHIRVTKRFESQVNPSQFSQLLLGIHEVSWPPGLRAVRNSINAATAQWNSKHTSGYGTRNTTYVIFEGELNIHFHHYYFL